VSTRHESPPAPLSPPQANPAPRPPRPRRKRVVAEDICVVDWMATWCRKCKYIKPKLQKLQAAEVRAAPPAPSPGTSRPAPRPPATPRARSPPPAQFPDVPLLFVDVNAVPYDLVKKFQVSKMPTVTVMRRGVVVRTYLCSEDGGKAVEAVRDMVAQERAA